MKNQIILAFSAMLILFGCTYDTLEENYSGIVIKTGTICGWCSRDDTLTITGTSVRYVNYTNCGTNIPTVDKSGRISQADFESLVSLLDFDDLQEINLNSCNISFDGCDKWLLVTNGTQSHYIRFGGTEDELQPLSDFLARLDQLQVQYSQTGD